MSHVADHSHELYTDQEGREPQTLPLRFHLPDGMSRYSYTCTDEEIASAGFIGPLEVPVAEYPHVCRWSQINKQYYVFDLRTINDYLQQVVFEDGNPIQWIVVDQPAPYVIEEQQKMNNDLRDSAEAALAKVDLTEPNPSGWVEVGYPYAGSLEVFIAGIPYPDPWNRSLPPEPAEFRDYYEQLAVTTSGWFDNSKYQYEVDGWRIFVYPSTVEKPVEYAYPADWVISGAAN